MLTRLKVVICALAMASTSHTVLADNTKSKNLPDIPPSVDSNFYFNGEQPAAKVELGRQLFFDKILSGNLNISCASCHHSLTGTGDGLALPVGEGGVGLGVTRHTGFGSDAIHERVPRNASPVFNLGAKEFVFMFADGRVTVDPGQPSGFASPAGHDLPLNLDNVLAVQAMFPVTSATEMAGQPGENPQADFAAAGDLPGLWLYIADKLRSVPEYVDMFEVAFDDVQGPQDITFAHAANAIAAFEAVSLRFDNSPFDRFLAGDKSALSKEQRKGMKLFYGKADCGGCHSGTYQTNQNFRAIAAPQLGGGKGDGLNGREDFGRFRVTQDPADMFRFRTPSLRNIALSAPYTHSGAFDTLEAVTRHYLDTVGGLENYDRSQARLPSRPDLDAIDFEVMDNPQLRANIAAANNVPPNSLTDKEVRQLLAFMHSLTDPAALDMRHLVPTRSPSGLPVFD